MRSCSPLKILVWRGPILSRDGFLASLNQVQAQKEIKEAQPKAKGRRRTMAGLQRKMLNESRELGLSPGEAVK